MTTPAETAADPMAHDYVGADDVDRCTICDHSEAAHGDAYDHAVAALDRNLQATDDLDQVTRAKLTYNAGTTIRTDIVMQIDHDANGAPGFWCSIVTAGSNGRLAARREFIAWSSVVRIKVLRTTAVHPDDQPF